MKRKCLLKFLILFLFLRSGLFAGSFPVSFFTAERPEFSIIQGFEYNLMHDMKYQKSGISTVAMVDAGELFVTGGFKANTKATDMALQLFYAPCFWDILSLGVSAKYHYFKFSDELSPAGEDLFSEHNLLPGGFIRVNLWNVWNFYFNAGSLFKYTIFPDYPKNASQKDNTLFFNSGCIFSPGDKWIFFLDFGNCSLFDDCLLGNFKFDLGFSYRFWQKFCFGSEVIFGWVDASVPQDSFNHLGFKMNWAVRF